MSRGQRVGEVESELGDQARHPRQGLGLADPGFGDSGRAQRSGDRRENRHRIPGWQRCAVVVIGDRFRCFGQATTDLRPARTRSRETRGGPRRVAVYGH